MTDEPSRPLGAHGEPPLGFAIALVILLITALIVGIGERNIARGCKDFPSKSCNETKDQTND